MPVAANGFSSALRAGWAPPTALQVDRSALAPVAVSQARVGPAPTRMHEYEAPLFPDGTVLPPDVCALLGFPYGTISRGLNLTVSMVEQIKWQKMGLPPMPQSSTPAKATVYFAPTPSLYSQSSTPDARSLMSSFDSACVLPEEPATDATQEFGEAPIVMDDLQADTAFYNSVSATALSPPEVEQDFYEAEETVMLPCCRSYVPRSKAEAALKHSDSCPCCQSPGVNRSMLVTITNDEREEIKSSVVLPCCRSRVPRDKVQKHLHNSDNCPCCQTPGIVFPKLRPVLSDEIQELPDLEASVDWTEQVVMPCCQSQLCRSLAEQAVADTATCPICNEKGITVSQLAALEISSAVCTMALVDFRRRSTLVVHEHPPKVNFAVNLRETPAEEEAPHRQDDSGPKGDEEGWESLSLGQISEMLQDYAKSQRTAPPNSEASNGSESVRDDDMARASSGGLFLGGGVDESPARGFKFGRPGLQFSQSASALVQGPPKRANPTPQGFIRNTTMFSDAPKLFSKGSAPGSLYVPLSSSPSPNLNPGPPPPTPQLAARMEEVREGGEVKEEEVGAVVEEEGWSEMSLSFVSQLLNEEAAKKQGGQTGEEHAGEEEKFVVPPLHH